MGRAPTNSVEYYRYLEQDERFLAELASHEITKRAHLHFADQYRDLAQSAERSNIVAS